MAGVNYFFSIPHRGLPQYCPSSCSTFHKILQDRLELVWHIQLVDQRFSRSTAPRANDAHAEWLRQPGDLATDAEIARVGKMMADLANLPS